MNKFKNKKGFTLIEMLVVIAIIAILVAIIVPTITSSTKKAQYAADAANLRSALAEAEIYHLNHPGTAHTCVANTCYTGFTSKAQYGTPAATASPSIILDSTGKFTATLGGYNATQLGEAAETGTLPTVGG